MLLSSSRALGLGLLVSLVGCTTNGATPGTDTGTVIPGEDTGTGPGTDGGPGNDAFVPIDGGPFEASCRTLTFPTVTVPDGVENTQCVILDLGNDLPMHVGSIHNVLGTASHHFVVYRASATSVETTTPFDCTPFVDTLSADSGSPLMITQRSDELLQLPPGIAYTLPAHQLIRLEIHYINLTGAPADVAPTAQFCPITDAEYTDDADFLFIGNPDIDIPAHSSFTLGPTFYRLDSRFSQAHFFAITGHTHQYGTNVVVNTAPASTGPFTSVYDVSGWSWSEPETSRIDPPAMIPSGGGFSFTCDWDNTSDQRVQFGEHADNEMCFFWAYYYPARAGNPHVCVHSDRYHVDICCPGNPICSQISAAF